MGYSGFDKFSKGKVICSKTLRLKDHMETITLGEVKLFNGETSWYVDTEISNGFMYHMPFDSLLKAKINFWKCVLL